MIANSTQKKNPFVVTRQEKHDILVGIEDGMLLQNKVGRAPNVPLQTRSSLGQQVIRHRFQISRYISGLRNYGMRPDYPVVHVLTMVKTSPAGRSGRPVMSVGYTLPQTASGGTIAPPPRFKKALKSPVAIFAPATYEAS